MSDVKTHEIDQKKQSVSLTDRALGHIKQYIVQRGSGVGIRLSIEQRGCSGYAYVIDFVDETQADDRVFEQDGIVIAVDPKSYLLVKGTQIDYVRDGLNTKFTYTNPNESGACGCGESFTVVDE